jgi:hypothetical protein
MGKSTMILTTIILPERRVPCHDCILQWSVNTGKYNGVGGHENGFRKYPQVPRFRLDTIFFSSFFVIDILLIITDYM